MIQTDKKNDTHDEVKILQEGGRGLSMDELHKADKPAVQQNPEYEIPFMDYFLVLLRRKKMILMIVLFAAVLAGGISFLLPDVYTATARILPPRSETSPAGLRSMPELGLLGGIFGGGSTVDVYVGILESRTVADRLIGLFALKEHYGQKYMEKTRLELSHRTAIKTSAEDQVVSISVEDVEPKRAADMANAYVAELDRINRSVNVTSGHLKKVFLEERLTKVEEDLSRAETALKDYREKYGIVAIADQARVVIEGAARIKGEIIAAQTELEVMKRFSTERNNQVVGLNSKIVELTRQLARIEKGDEGHAAVKNASAKEPDSNLYISISEMPALGLQLARLEREARVQEEVYKLITSQYEMAKIEEAKDINTIQILDRAIPPDRKSGPKRILIVALSMALGFFVGVLSSFAVDFRRRLMEQDPARYQEIARNLGWRRKGNLATELLG